MHPYNTTPPCDMILTASTDPTTTTFHVTLRTQNNEMQTEMYWSAPTYWFERLLGNGGTIALTEQYYECHSAQTQIPLNGDQN